ncbi:MAG: TMEM14 family protein [Chthoniobacterales bacterium]
MALSNWTATPPWITNRATMLEPARIYFLVFGILTIAGGVIGYVKAGSVVSVIAGAITGILLLVSAWILPMHREIGLALALLTSAVLAGQFIPRAFRTRRLVPAGVMSLLSVIGIAIAIAAWIGK